MSRARAAPGPAPGRRTRSRAAPEPGPARPCQRGAAPWTLTSSCEPRRWSAGSSPRASAPSCCTPGCRAAALVGLLTWAAFLASGSRPLAWAAVGLLMAAIGLGLCTVTLWTPYPARKPNLQPGLRGADRLSVRDPHDDQAE